MSSLGHIWSINPINSVYSIQPSRAAHTVFMQSFCVEKNCFVEFADPFCPHKMSFPAPLAGLGWWIKRGAFLHCVLSLEAGKHSMAAVQVHGAP